MNLPNVKLEQHLSYTSCLCYLCVFLCSYLVGIFERWTSRIGILQNYRLWWFSCDWLSVRLCTLTMSWVPGVLCCIGWLDEPSLPTSSGYGIIRTSGLFMPLWLTFTSEACVCTGRRSIISWYSGLLPYRTQQPAAPSSPSVSSWVASSWSRRRPFVWASGFGNILDTPPSSGSQRDEVPSAPSHKYAFE